MLGTKNICLLIAGLQLFSDNKAVENAAISSSNGHKFNTGTRLSSDSLIDTEAFDRAEALSEDEFADVEELSAAVSTND